MFNLVLLIPNWNDISITDDLQGFWRFVDGASQYLTNLMHKICFTISFISCLYMFRAHVLIIRRSNRDFDVLLTVHLSIFISVFNQLDAQNLFHNKFHFMLLHVSSTCAHHQEVKQVYWRFADGASQYIYLSI